MQSTGLRVKSPFGDIDLARVKATNTPAEIGPVDIVIFAVKVCDSDKAAEASLSLVGPDKRVITLQNGIDSVDTLSRFVSRAQVMGGATYLSGYIESPGVYPNGDEVQTVEAWTPPDLWGGLSNRLLCPHINASDARGFQGRLRGRQCRAPAQEPISEIQG
jgi:hypothetical protein